MDLKVGGTEGNSNKYNFSCPVVGLRENAWVLLFIDTNYTLHTVTCYGLVQMHGYTAESWPRAAATRQCAAVLFIETDGG